MSDNLASQKYNELVAAIRELRDAEKKLDVCKRRVDELTGLLPEQSQYKSRKQTFTAKEFRAGCKV